MNGEGPRVVVIASTDGVKTPPRWVIRRALRKASRLGQPVIHVQPYRKGWAFISQPEEKAA